MNNLSSNHNIDLDQLDPRAYIIVKGARVNNLKNLSVAIPRNKLVVITGLSGSGKSSLAFDTLFAEGQRMYVESLSAYARQFLGRMEKPAVDYIRGVAPAIAIEQKNHNKHPRSTVGTSTEIYDYLKLLYASGHYLFACQRPAGHERQCL
jgi:excinuclease ABC subunit A